ncbi:unnamed protein product, partial [Ectocarpus sp. 8 AP-2014]
SSQAVAQDLADLRRSFIEETSSKSRQLRGLRRDANDLKRSLGDFSGSSNERLGGIEACLQGAATKEELALKANARDAEAVFTALRADCALRARQASLASLETTVSRLQE